MIRAALVGHPVAHSLSPTLHHAAAEACGLAFEYVLVDTRPDALAPTLARLRAEGYAGYNVTAPHKEAVFRSLGALTGAARAIGAVNTVVFEPGRAVGHNTDAAGLRLALEAEAPPSGPAVVLGAGGAARAAAHVLRGANRPFTVVARRADRAAAIHDSSASWDAVATHLEGAALVLNCASRAAADAIAALPFARTDPDALVFDLNYGPAARPVVDAVHGAGRRAVDGLAMLAWQGIGAFRLWTDSTPSFGLVMSALRAAATSIDTR